MIHVKAERALFAGQTTTPPSSLTRN
jgi:hypothetical protein